MAKSREIVTIGITSGGAVPSATAAATVTEGG
jgi:hypothetical protein